MIQVYHLDREQEYIKNLFSFYKIIDQKDLKSTQSDVWLLSSFNNILNHKDLNNDYFIRKHKINARVTEIIKEIELENTKEDLQLSTSGNSESYDTVIKENDINTDNNYTYDSDNSDNKLLEVLDDIPKRFSGVMLDIIEDLISLSKKTADDSGVYRFYIKQIITIITLKGRMFYIGLLFLIISICLFFVEIT